jgi:serine/threonine protein kinase
MSPCLAEDELLALGLGVALGDSPDAEAHLADCATCSALLAALVRDAPMPRWDALTGTTLGPYRLDAQIGAGGMSAVYRAWDERLARNVAIKVLHASVPERRLAIEARAAGAISHPAVVAVHDIGSAGGITYIVQELVDGETLRSLIKRGALSSERAATLAVELVQGLAAAGCRCFRSRSPSYGTRATSAPGRSEPNRSLPSAESEAR